MRVTLVREGDALHPDAQYVVYDLELVGSHLWNVAARNLYRPEAYFDGLVMPPLDPIPPPPHPDLFPVTKEYLADNGAQDWASVGPAFLEWLAGQRAHASSQIVLVAHGNFAFDKPTLERAFGTLSTQIPPWVLFLDTLPLLRRQHRGIASYGLGALYKRVFGRAIPNQHTALGDVNALSRLLYHSWPSSLHAQPGAYYPAYCVPLQLLKGIGRANERVLIDGGVLSVTHLLLTFMHECDLDVSRMATLLQEKHFFLPNSAQEAASGILAYMVRLNVQ